MDKSERLNDMIRYLNGQEFFNLHDLMEKYRISKSTALRDIASLERLGMPIFVEHGRNGRYGILKNRLLSPIMFTVDEVYALYFSMLTLKSYQSTPFHVSVDKLNEKFESCLSQKQIDNIRKMEKILQFETNPHQNESEFLDKILQSIVNGSACTIQYSKNNEEKSCRVQFCKISAKFGQWYVSKSGGGTVHSGLFFEIRRASGIRETRIIETSDPGSNKGANGSLPMMKQELRKERREPLFFVDFRMSKISFAQSFSS